MKRMAFTRWMMPFCRVMRPTKRRNGTRGSIPYFSSAAVVRTGLYSVEVDAVVDDVDFHSSTSKSRSTSAFVSRDTAMTASAISIAVFSTQHEKS